MGRSHKSRDLGSLARLVQPPQLGPSPKLRLPYYRCTASRSADCTATLCGQTTEFSVTIFNAPSGKEFLLSKIRYLPSPHVSQSVGRYTYLSVTINRVAPALLILDPISFINSTTTKLGNYTRVHGRAPSLVLSLDGNLVKIQREGHTPT